jgi:hypothetical protein
MLSLIYSANEDKTTLPLKKANKAGKPVQNANNGGIYLETTW